MHFHAANGRFVINVSGLAKHGRSHLPAPPPLLHSPLRLSFNERQKADDRNNLSASTGVRCLIGCAELVESKGGEGRGWGGSFLFIRGFGVGACIGVGGRVRGRKCFLLIDGD